jgi:hypothetical protein
MFLLLVANSVVIVVISLLFVIVTTPQLIVSAYSVHIRLLLVPGWCTCNLDEVFYILVFVSLY